MDEAEIRALQDRFDARYKQKDDCDRDMQEQTDRIHTIDLRLTTIENKQVFNNWLTGLVAAGIVALVIKVFLGG